MENINFYYLVTFLSLGTFLVQFILSLLGHDIDGDGNVDFDTSSVFSFKGVIHFCIGCFGWLSLCYHNNNYVRYQDIIFSACIGVIFVFILYYIYILCFKFQHLPVVNNGKALIGKTGTVNFISKSGKEILYNVTICSNGELLSKVCYGRRKNVSYEAGQSVVIIDYKNGKYFI